MTGNTTESPTGQIAVIGLACRFPGADSPDQFWSNLRDGSESVTFFSAQELAAAGVDPTQLQDADFVAAKGVLQQADYFDAAFFGFSPREAALMDPQQRVFLECAWTALEDAGYDSRDYPGEIGVFAGSILSMYLLQNLWPNRDLVSAAGDFQVAIGNDPTFLATSTSYQLDLRGPSVCVGTACSTSLVAVHLACQSLLAYESDMALAGGVSVHLPLVGGYRYKQGGILSPDGHCRPFDAAAQGTVSSDGVGIVVLKRLDDAISDRDFIHAVIRGSAINNDGRVKVGYTAPSVEGESLVITEALAMADVEPDSISMVETHGAGTLLGDPIEVAALVEAFGDCGGKRRFCALGSVKSNIGHVDAAAGIAGLIKAVLALRHREAPPTLHFQHANPEIDFDDSPFYVNPQLQSFPHSETPLRAGVSSFGIGGTNCHMVLEEAPSQRPATNKSTRPFEILMLSARTATALDAATERLADYLDHSRQNDLADVGYTLRRGRRCFAHRRVLVCRNHDDAVAALLNRGPQKLMSSIAPSGRPTVAFMFPGLGDHYAGMGWEFYCTEVEFRHTIDRCAQLLHNHLDTDIRDFLFPDRDWSNPVLETTDAGSGSNLDLRAMLGRGGTADTRDPDLPTSAQPAIFVTEVALAELLKSWGITPDAMIGSSIGEFTAAYLSGVFSLSDALEVVAARARLIQSHVQTGAMLAVPLAEDELRELLPANVSLGAVNGAALCIASGEKSGVVELEPVLRERNVSCQRLRSTHAYHSKMMEVIVEPLRDVLRRVELAAPVIPYISCLTGTWITDEQATDPDYWAQHLCHTVRLQQGLAELLSDPSRVLLEVGPGQGLTSHAINEMSRAPAQDNRVIPTMRWSYDLQSESATLLCGIGGLWLAGVSLDMPRVLARDHQRRIPLPTYPFERKKYWIDPPGVDTGNATGIETRKRPDVSDWFYLPCWKPSVLSMVSSDAHGAGNWLVFVDRCGLGMDLAVRLRERGAYVSTVLAGGEFGIRGDEYVIDPRRVEDYESLVRELCGRGRPPENILNLWCLTTDEDDSPSSDRFRAYQETGYYSVMRLLRAVLRQGLEHPVKLHIIANHLFGVHHDDKVLPEKATVRAPAMVAPQERPGLICRCVDIDTPSDDSHRRELLLTQVMEEIHNSSVESMVALRGGRRWILGYEPVRIGGVHEQHRPFRRHGVYLLTGGLGGVGLVLARHLAQTVQARLVLVGRSEFPDRADWERWLNEHDESEAISSRIRQLQEFEDLGAEVLVLRADVSNEDAMRRALAAIDEHFGELHGVIHGAGAVGMETFREISEATTADSESQFVAKVHGLIVLDKVLADRPLDFCLLMSSLSAVLGGLGFAAYSAANLFLDAFARHRNRTDGATWTSVDWDSWRLPDMRPVVEGLGATVTDFVMQPDEGAAACERILAQGTLDQVIVSSGDLKTRLRQWIDRDAQQTTASELMTLHERPHMSTAYEVPSGELELEIAAIWQELFGVTSVGRHDNFFELGGHSLLATQLNARLSAKLHVDISLATLLQAPTIAELAVAVVTKRAEQTDPTVLEGILAKLGHLSGEDLERLLAEEAVSPATGNDQ